MVRQRQQLRKTNDIAIDESMEWAINERITAQLAQTMKSEKEREEVLAELGLSEEQVANNSTDLPEKTEEQLTMERMLVEKRMNNLANRDEHIRLRNALVREINKLKKRFLTNKESFLPYFLSYLAFSFNISENTLVETNLILEVF